jgi:hypothetical protein
MITQLCDFAQEVQSEAQVYLGLYKRNESIRNLHPITIQGIERNDPELADCIDFLIWDQIVMVNRNPQQ